MLMLLHSKAQFLPKAKCAKRDFYCFLLHSLNIKRVDIALTHFHFKITQNGNSMELTVVIAFNTVSCNRT